MTTVRALLAEATQILPGDDAAREAEILLTHAVGKSRAWLYAHGDDEVVESVCAKLRDFVERRSRGEPIAYLVGRREFWSLDLEVSADVLIPRADTELLVEVALRHIPQSVKVDIVDLGTGSGAIALAIARERSQSLVVATDASEAALAVAKLNSQRLNIANVLFVLSDWFSALGGKRFDVIVSNPPYISDSDAHLNQGDLRYEPRSALASGPDGLVDIRRIVLDAPSHLNLHGFLAIEHGFEQADSVRDLFRKSGFVDIDTERDLEDRERVTHGRIAG